MQLRDCQFHMRMVWSSEADAIQGYSWWNCVEGGGREVVVLSGQPDTRGQGSGERGRGKVVQAMRVAGGLFGARCNSGWSIPLPHVPLHTWTVRM